MSDVITKNIIDLLGLQNLPEERKKALLEQMSGVVQSRIARRVDEKLTDEEKEEFNQLVARGADEKTIATYMSQHVSNFDDIATEEILKFKEDMVNEAQSLKDALKK